MHSYRVAMRNRAAPLALALLIVGVATSATLAQAPDEDATAAARLAKHRAYVGWQLGDGTFSTLRIRGHVTDEKGMRTQDFVIASRGPIYSEAHTMLAIGNTIERGGYTGNIFWLRRHQWLPNARLRGLRQISSVT